MIGPMRWQQEISEIVPPRSTTDVVVTMQAQKETPPDMHCKDKFLVQSVIVNEGTNAKEITAEMFSKESGNVVDEVKLRVAYVPPSQPPSPVHEGSEEGSSPRGSLSDNGNLTATEFNSATKAYSEQKSDAEQEIQSSEPALISRLTEENNSIIQQNNKLRQELESLRRDVSKKQIGFPIVIVAVVALLGILLGYILKK